MADCGFWTLLADSGLVADFGFLTLRADFNLRGTCAFHSTNLFLSSLHHVPTDSIALFYAYKPTLSLRLGTI